MVNYYKFIDFQTKILYTINIKARLRKYSYSALYYDITLRTNNTI